VYSFRTPVFKRLECTGVIRGLQVNHHFSQESKGEWGKTGLFSTGTAQIQFNNGIGGTQNVGDSSSNSVHIASFRRII
jgi:hypothetical protein